MADFTMGEADTAGCLQRHDATDSNQSVFQTMLTGHTCMIEYECSTWCWSHRTSRPRGATSTCETTQNTDKEYSCYSLQSHRDTQIQDQIQQRGCVEKVTVTSLCRGRLRDTRRLIQSEQRGLDCLYPRNICIT